MILILPEVVTLIPDQFLFADKTTGNSGGPVFDSERRVIGTHWGTNPARELRGQGKRVNKAVIIDQRANCVEGFIRVLRFMSGDNKASIGVVSRAITTDGPGDCQRHTVQM